MYRATILGPLGATSPKTVVNNPNAWWYLVLKSKVLLGVTPRQNPVFKSLTTILQSYTGATLFYPNTQIGGHRTSTEKVFTYRAQTQLKSILVCILINFLPIASHFPGSSAGSGRRNYISIGEHCNEFSKHPFLLPSYLTSYATTLSSFSIKIFMSAASAKPPLHKSGSSQHFLIRNHASSTIDGKNHGNLCSPYISFCTTALAPTFSDAHSSAGAPTDRSTTRFPHFPICSHGYAHTNVHTRARGSASICARLAHHHYPVDCFRVPNPIITLSLANELAPSSLPPSLPFFRRLIHQSPRPYRHPYFFRHNILPKFRGFFVCKQNCVPIDPFCLTCIYVRTFSVTYPHHAMIDPSSPIPTPPSLSEQTSKPSSKSNYS